MKYNQFIQQVNQYKKALKNKTPFLLDRVEALEVFNGSSEYFDKLVKKRVIQRFEYRGKTLFLRASVIFSC